MSTTQFIAHRGNTHGPQPTFENQIQYLLHAYDECGAIECDIQTYNGQLYFGHDDPQEIVSPDLIMQDNWFCHAKDLESLGTLLDMGAHCFWHQQDTVTLTSKGYIWCYPKHYPEHERAVWLDFEDSFASMDLVKGWGLCSDRRPAELPPAQMRSAGVSPFVM